MATETAADVTDDKPEAADSPRSAAYWLAQLESAGRREEDWHKQGDKVIARYMDDRRGAGTEKRVNILWANTDVQKGALFAQLGNPDVRRLFPKPGRDNKIARTAALVLERALVACNNRYEPENEIENAVEDQLLPARGQCWLEYDATVESVEEEIEQADPATGEVTMAVKTTERIVYQDARFCHVDWKDFRHGSAKAWKDVPWVARLRLFTKEDVKAKWPEKADQIRCDYVVDEQYLSKERKQGDDFKRAKVWEIWFKPLKIRVHVAEGCEVELDREEDPYRLEGFFPCPKPLYGVKTTSSLTPKPEFLQYQDQADELDRVNTRIWKLLEKLRYCGVYDASGEDGDALEGIGDLDDGQFKPYKNFRALSEGGGLAQAFQVRDLAPIAATVQSLAQRAVQLIEAIYEITGLSDILRGVSDPTETLGAQELKARSGGSRIDRKKDTVQRFVRALYRMKAELIGEHFEREQLEEMTGIRLPLAAERDAAKAQLAAMAQQAQQMAAMQAQAQAAQQQPPQPGQPPQAPQAPQQMPAMPQMPQLDADQLAELKDIAAAPTWEEVSAILRSDDRRNYKIDVETDATNYAETEEEKSQRLEFVKTMVELIQVAVQAAAASPALLGLSKELIMFAARAFKVGRTLEETLDDTFEQVASQPQQQQAAPADPLLEMRKADLQASIDKKRVDIEGQKELNVLKVEAQRIDVEAQRAKAETDAQVAAVKQQLELQKQATAALKLQLEEMKMMLGAQDRRDDAEHKREERAQKRTEGEQRLAENERRQAEKETA